MPASSQSPSWACAATGGLYLCWRWLSWSSWSGCWSGRRGTFTNVRGCSEMSLKNFHVVFIVAATLLLFCALQALGNFRASGSLLTAAACVLSLAAGGSLIRFEMLFL